MCMRVCGRSLRRKQHGLQTFIFHIFYAIFSFDIESLPAEKITLRDDITKCFSTEIIKRSDGAIWNEEQDNFFAKDEDQTADEE